MVHPPGSNRPFPHPPRDSDDWIAIVVAFGMLGGLAGWLLVGGWPTITSGLEGEPSAGRLVESITTNPADADPSATSDPVAASANATAPSDPASETATTPEQDPAIANPRVPAMPPTAAPPPGGTIPPPPPTTAAANSDGTLIVPAPQLPDNDTPNELTIVRPPLAFTDVADGYWGKPYIDALTARGVLNGLPEGVFEPNRPMTRAEFAVQVAKAFNLEPSLANKVFSDVAPDYWASPTIQEAVTTGFMTGYPEGDFRPNETLPRLQVLIAIATGLSLPPPGNTEALLQQYQDQAEIPFWARKKVAAAIAAGIIAPSPTTGNRLRPSAPATRAEVAALIYSALAYMGKVEPIAAK